MHPWHDYLITFEYKKYNISHTMNVILSFGTE